MWGWGEVGVPICFSINVLQEILGNLPLRYVKGLVDGAAKRMELRGRRERIP
jgi:hypothetical protein